MVFSTHIFVFYFLPLVLAVYYGLGWLARAVGSRPAGVSLTRNLFVLVASYVFYGWANPWFVLLMFSVTVLNYWCALVIGWPKAGRRLRFWGVTAAITISLSSLGFFKYFVFFQNNLNHLLSWFGSDGVRVLQIALPVGISFYTFHALSYTIDVFRRTSPPVRSFIDFACYIALYPQLVAGPIIRYNTVARQLVSRGHSWEKFASGVALFILGLSKKILLADPVGRVADAAFGAGALTTADAWLGVTAYAFQIYFDFSGYSDMAIGLGRMIGFEFPKNFDSPYHSESITEFWRRWHISLSTFLRDYLYIPLGGNRLGPCRTYLNLCIVMLLGGLWHGANWTFIAWGAYHGALLAFERFLGKQTLYRAFPRPVRVLFTFVLVLFSWVLFRAGDFQEAVRYFGFLLGGGRFNEGTVAVSSLLYAQGTMLLMVVCAAVAMARTQAHGWSETITWPKALMLQPLFCASLLAMFVQSFSPFLYFQF